MFTFSFLPSVPRPTFSGKVALKCVGNNMAFRSSSDTYCREGICPRTNTEFISRDIYLSFHLITLIIWYRPLRIVYVLGWATGRINIVLIIINQSAPTTRIIYTSIKADSFELFFKLPSFRLGQVESFNLFAILIYFYYYSWVSLYFFVLFIGLTVLFS